MGAAMMMDLFAAAGVRVVPVEQLGELAAWVSTHRVLLIDAGITPDQLHQVACLLLPRALQTPPPSP